MKNVDMFLALGVALIACQPAHAATPVSAVELIQRHQAWRGGQAYADVHAAHLAGTSKVAGLEGRLDRRLDLSKAEPAVRVERRMGPLHQIRGGDSRGSWALTLSGQVEVISTKESRKLVQEEGLYLGRLPAGGDLAVGDVELIDGRNCTSVGKATPEGRYALLIEADTGLLCGALLDQGEGEQRIVFSDWRWVAGVRMAFASVMTDADRHEAFIADHVQLNPIFEDDDFSRPAAAQVVQFDAGRSDSGWLDFEFHKQRQIFIPGAVNGHDVPMMLDTGAEVTLIDKGLAEALGIVGEGEIPAVGTSGSESVALARGVDIRLGAVTLKNLTVGIYDFAPLAAAMKHPLPVLLGKEVMNEAVIDIDFAASRIRMVDRAAYRPTTAAREVALVTLTGLRAVPIRIEDGPEVLGMFDLGSAKALTLFPSYVAEHGLLDGRAVSEGSSHGVGGLSAVRTMTVQRLHLAGFDLEDVAADVPEAHGIWVRDVAAANLGLPLFSRFRLAIDFAGDRLFLTPGDAVEHATGADLTMVLNNDEGRQVTMVLNDDQQRGVTLVVNKGEGRRQAPVVDF